ncbi:MAG: allantoate amidohydrolase [Rhizobiaceae bacterium]|nr:allantoate amidohydrolase [Rhizobiaceae bacterium]
MTSSIPWFGRPLVSEPSRWTVTGLLDEIADIGRDSERGGYSRHGLDDAELSLRAWFIGKAEALGLTVSTDADTNIWAWWGEPGPGAIATGSHLDSVPGGGSLDGPLGVVSGLVAVARLREKTHQPPRPLALVVFVEEEGGRFGMPCLGSRLAGGILAPSAARALADREQIGFADALASAGHDPQLLGPVEWVNQLAAFIELHVEQGRGLIDLGQPLAIASAVRPHGRWRLEYTGEGNHAGTTLLADRHDPVLPMAAAVLAARRLAGEAPDAVATVGRLSVIPGGTNVIASKATAWLDVRAEQNEVVQSVVTGVIEAAELSALQEGCGFSWQRESWTPRVEFDDQLRAAMHRALGQQVPELSTGAGHDAAVLAEVAPTGMIFVRNPTGASHTPAESASAEDCELGAVVLAGVLEGLLK